MKLKRWQIGEFIFVVLVGSFFHFLYKISGDNSIVGLFAPVNESVWEHLKLLFFPATLFAIAEYIAIGKDYKGFFTNKVFAILLGMLTIVALFYTYTGIIGKNFMVADIATFVIGAGVVSRFSFKMLPKTNSNNIVGILLFILIALCFFIFTWYPFNIALFKTP